MLTVTTADFSAKFTLVWRPLTVDGRRVYLWDYPRVRHGSDTAVIYRHVVEVSGTVHTIYVGEGSSLNGPRKASLAHQYSHGGHGPTRVKVRKFFEDRESGWTELLDCPEVDISVESNRLGLESMLDGLYYFESLRSADFKKRGLVYLNGHQEA
jgi:hypothetical protein